MNKKRRAGIARIVERLEEIKTDLQDIIDAEQEAMDNIPESLWYGERHNTMQEALDLMEEALGDLSDTTDKLEGI